jgi:DNA-directed RNA polymerase subunit RPC12/RpoP
LICARCNTPYEPPGKAEYEGAFEAETPVACPHCDVVLVCHWCGAPFGPVEEDD